MNKNELVAFVASAADIDKTKAAKAADAVFDAITETLKKGEELRMTGFGTFAVSKRAASEGRNPRTGEKIKIAASNVVKFKPGKGLKDEVNTAKKK